MVRKDKIYHLIICLAVSFIVAQVITNTGCDYLPAFLGGAFAGICLGIGAEAKDCIYNDLPLVDIFNFDLLADAFGSVAGASLGACFYLLI